jgi:hypothetical protein
METQVQTINFNQQMIKDAFQQINSNYVPPLDEINDYISSLEQQEKRNLILIQTRKLLDKITTIKNTIIQENHEKEKLENSRKELFTLMKEHNIKPQDIKARMKVLMEKFKITNIFSEDKKINMIEMNDLEIHLTYVSQVRSIIKCCDFERENISFSFMADESGINLLSCDIHYLMEHDQFRDIITLKKLLKLLYNLEVKKSK